VPKPLSVDQLRLDAGTQNRIAINEDVVEDYAELIGESDGNWPFAPVDVFHDGKDYFVADGFHRTLGAKKAKRASVPCEVHKGTAKDARIFGMTANDLHGLRMTRADKRACVEWLLDNEPKLVHAEVAEKSGVTLRTVRRIVADRKPSVMPPKLPPPNLGRTLSSTRSGGDSSGKDDSTEAPGKTPQDKDHRPPGSGKAKPVASSDKLGKCPNCASVKWTTDDFGCVVCAKCNHPHGEPVGDADEDRVKTLRLKWIKTIEADIRAADDLNEKCAKPKEHDEAIRLLKQVLRIAKEWLE